MGNYLLIARAYMRWSAALAWGFFLLCLLACFLDTSTWYEEKAGNPVLSRKSYVAMFVYFNACVLGVLLRDEIAHPWASVLPHYRQKHLLVTSFIALLLIAIPIVAMMFVGKSDASPMTVAALFLTCLAAGLWTLHHPIMGILAIPFLVFVNASSSSDPDLARFLAGANPSVSAALVLISLLALWAFAWRLLAMNEDNVMEYGVARLWGNYLRGRGQTFQGQAKTIADHLATLPAEKRARLQNFDWLKNPFTNLKQVDSLSGYSERSLWQRLQLCRLGAQPLRLLASVGQLMVITLIMMPLLMRLFPGRDTVLIFSVQVMMNPFNIWPSWFKRRHRLSYESLRPRTRQEFIRELGLALLWDISGCWLGGILFMGLTAAIWAPELLQVKSIILFIFSTGVGQLCAYAMGVWPLKRGMVASVWSAFCAFMAIEFWILFAMNGRIGIEVNVAIASLLAATSVAAIPLAYRRWCRADLD
jgi:hypothetical protein